MSFPFKNKQNRATSNKERVIRPSLPKFTRFLQFQMKVRHLD